jgi:hypothetical protein
VILAVGVSKSNAWEAALLDLLFLNQNFAGVGDATGLRGSTVAGNLYLAAHTADPGETGTQTTNECTYAGYGRVARPRDGSNWVRTGNSISPTSDVQWPFASGGPADVATHWSAGIASSGSTAILYKGTLSPSVTCNPGVAPKLLSSSTVTED